MCLRRSNNHSSRFEFLLRDTPLACRLSILTISIIKIFYAQDFRARKINYNSNARLHLIEITNPIKRLLEGPSLICFYAIVLIKYFYTTLMRTMPCIVVEISRYDERIKRPIMNTWRFIYVINATNHLRPGIRQVNVMFSYERRNYDNQNVRESSLSFSGVCCCREEI